MDESAGEGEYGEGASRVEAVVTDAPVTDAPNTAPAPDTDESEACVADGEYCSGQTSCCSPNADCRRVNGDGKEGPVCVADLYRNHGGRGYSNTRRYGYTRRNGGRGYGSGGSRWAY